MKRDTITMIGFMVVFTISLIFLSSDIQMKLIDHKIVKEENIKGNVQLVSTNKITEYVAEASIIKETSEDVLKEATKEEVKEEVKEEPPVNPFLPPANNGVATPGYAWPTQPNYGISSGYGYRIDPFTGYQSFHGAIDIYGPGQGSAIYTVNNGVITEKGWTSSYGYYYVINHNNGKYTLYAHLSGFAPNINVGSLVYKGQLIGYMGMTGSATGPHLHFEVWIGYPWRGGYQINPWSLY